MRSAAICALCHPVWTRAALPHPAALDGAPVVGREAVPRTKGASGVRSQAVGSDVLPLTAPAAESTWPPRLLKGIDLVPASEESDPTLAKAAESRLSENCDHHRGGAVLFFWKRARTLAPPSHLISAGMCIPQFSASSSSRSFHSLPSLAPPMYRVSEMPWILIPPPLLLVCCGGCINA